MDRGLLESSLEGNTRSLARLITSVESQSSAGLEILRELFKKSGQAQVIGVTGSPGAGKSSLVDRLAVEYRKTHEQIGIVAVDPSSPFTGGAILGDRIRMQTLALDPGVYIRSMATRGNLGGLAAATADVVTVLDAAGRNPVIVETVGVGQDEVEIAKLADISVVVVVPGMGDDVQAIKAGIMEIGDIFVINKSDQPGADRMEATMQAMLSLAVRDDGWSPPIVRTVATRGDGIDRLVEAIDTCHRFFEDSNLRITKRRETARQRLVTLLRERLLNAAIAEVLPDGALDQIAGEIAERREDPYSVVERILAGARFGSPK